VTTVASSFHIEINPGDAGIHDRYVVQEVIKEIAQYNPLDKSFKGAISRAVSSCYLCCEILVLVPCQLCF
jgi:hypothetical protein